MSSLRFTSSLWQEDVERALVEALHACSREVADLLGAKDLFVYDLPDNRFDTVPLLEVIKTIEELLDRLQPQIIYTHHGGDLNIGHVVVHQVVLTATRPVPGHPVKEVYTFEVPSSTGSGVGFWAVSPLLPNVSVDLSTTLETKLKAMLLYESETRQFSHPRSLEALRAVAYRQGSVVGV